MGKIKFPEMPEKPFLYSLDPETFAPRRGILTRYGRKILKEGSKFYEKTPVSVVINPSKYRSIDEEWEG